MLDCLYVGIGGFLGSVARYLIGRLPYQPDNGFPIKTLLINVIGAFLLAALAASAAKGQHWDPRVLLMLKVGVCGGFTTFSTFACETSGLWQNSRPDLAALYVVASLVLSLGAVFLAQYLLAK